MIVICKIMLQNNCEHQPISENISSLQQNTSIPSFFYKLNNYNTLEKIYKTGQDERQSEDIVNDSLTHNEKEHSKKENKSNSEANEELYDIPFHQDSNQYGKSNKNFQANDQQNFFQQYRQKIRKQILQYDQEKQKSSNNSHLYKKSTKRRQQISCRLSINQQDEQKRREKEKIYRQLSSIQFSLLEKSQNYQEYCKKMNHSKKIEKSNKSIKTINRKKLVQDKNHQIKQGKKELANFLIESKGHKSESQPIQFELSSLSLHENSLAFNPNLHKQQISNMDDFII